MKPIILSIKKLFKIKSTDIYSQITLVYNDKCYMNLNNLVEISVIGLASMTISDKMSNKQRLYVTEIEAQINDDFNCSDNLNTYVAETITGDKYLIGTGNRPYPIYECLTNFQSNISSKSGKSIKITYSALNPPLLIII